MDYNTAAKYRREQDNIYPTRHTRTHKLEDQFWRFYKDVPNTPTGRQNLDIGKHISTNISDSLDTEILCLRLLNC